MKTARRTGAKLKPGQRGTKKLLSRYGDKLIGVLYRYDEKRNKRFTTVELIIEEKDWRPKRKPLPSSEIVGLRVGVKEVEVQSKIRRAGGKWNRERKVWEIRYERVREIGMESRIVRSKSL